MKSYSIKFSIKCTVKTIDEIRLTNKGFIPQLTVCIGKENNKKSQTSNLQTCFN